MELKLVSCAGLAAIGLFAGSANAQEIATGVGLVCDTKEQIELLVKADDKDQFEAALQRINADKTACGMVNMAFIRGKKIGQVLTKKGLHEIFEILVMAADSGGGMQPIRPEKQVAVFLVKSQDV